MKSKSEGEPGLVNAEPKEASLLSRGFDVAGLQTGDYIDPKEIAKLFGVEIESKQYPWKLLYLKEYIEEESLASGQPFLCKSEDYGLRILHPEEATIYLYGRFQKTLKGALRIEEKYKRIDLSETDTATKREHERNTYVMNRYHQAITGAKARLEAPEGNYPTAELEDS